MFGNYPLPNIAPSLLLLLPPPSHTLPPLPPPLSPSRPPTWAKRGRACHQRPPTTFMPRHRVPPPLHRQPRPPHHHPPPLPLSRDVGERFLPRHAAQTMTAPCYVTANDNHPVPHHPTKAPAVKRHITKMEGARRREMEGGEKGNRRWGGGHLCPLPPAASFRKPARRCAPHIPPRLAFQTRTRRCASHTPPRLIFQTPARRCASHTPSRSVFQMRTGGVQPTPLRLSFLIPPPSFGGDSFQERGGVKLHTALFELNYSPPTTGGFLFLQHMTGAVWYPHAVPILLCLPPPSSTRGVLM